MRYKTTILACFLMSLGMSNCFAQIQLEVDSICASEKGLVSDYKSILDRILKESLIKYIDTSFIHNDFDCNRFLSELDSDYATNLVHNTKGICHTYIKFKDYMPDQSIHIILLLIPNSVELMKAEMLLNGANHHPTSVIYSYFFYIRRFGNYLIYIDSSIDENDFYMKKILTNVNAGDK